MPDAYERTLPEVFPDFAPGNFTWDEHLEGWVWTTFNEWQWDVNWTNPDVLVEYADIILFLANVGVEVVRLDAIAFTWKRMGTSCQNQPEVHALTQALRSVARIACPALAFKAEAIVGPRDLPPYLGQGERTGKVSDLAYHNSLMVQAWSMVATKDVRLTAYALRALPPVHPSSTWVTYLRCHDDIGWAIDDGDAAAVGWDGFLHRRFLSDWYVGDFPGSWSRGLVFQANSATGDRRISGTTAALSGLDSTRGLDPVGVEVSIARIFLGHALIAGFGGVPIIWSGDELGLSNDAGWADEPGHEDDNRWVHRPRIDWEVAQRRHTTGTVESRVFEGLAHLAKVRARLPHMHASVPSVVLDVWNPGVLAFARHHPLGTMLCVYNVTELPRSVPGWLLRQHGLTESVGLAPRVCRVVARGAHPRPLGSGRGAATAVQGLLRGHRQPRRRLLRQLFQVHRAWPVGISLRQRQIHRRVELGRLSHGGALAHRQVQAPGRARRCRRRGHQPHAALGLSRSIPAAGRAGRGGLNREQSLVEFPREIAELTQG
jgi:amylosucrase